MLPRKQHEHTCALDELDYFLCDHCAVITVTMLPERFFGGENVTREAVKQLPSHTDLLIKGAGHTSEANRGKKQSSCAFNSNGKKEAPQNNRS